MFAIHFNTFQYISIHFNTFQYISIHFNTFQYISIHFNTFQYISIHFNTFQYISIIINLSVRGLTPSPTRRLCGTPRLTLDLTGSHSKWQIVAYLFGVNRRTKVGADLRIRRFFFCGFCDGLCSKSAREVMKMTDLIQRERLV